MPDTLVLAVEDAVIAYGSKTIFDGLSFHIQDRDRIALVGKNGTGKSTLMRLVQGNLDLDAGKRFHLFGTKIGYLAQDIIPQVGQSIEDFVLDGLAAERDTLAYKVEQILEPLHLQPNWLMTDLSGGQLRRAALAQALVASPDILLLDEPTNHLDLDIIEWLETYLKNYQGALVCVSHDKMFLGNITNKTFWLDRGRLRAAPKGFKHFEDWSQELLEQEARELHNRSRIVGLEVDWANRGVKARRKRNQARLENMKIARDKLKRDVSSYKRATRKIEWEAPKLETGAKVVGEFYKVSKTMGDKKLLDGFSLKLIRGDRIGILGRNGSGKTTFLKLLVGLLQPDQGTVKRARDLEISYMDQARVDLVADKSLWHTLCPDGGDHVNVMGKSRHVVGYLRDFMFDADMANQAVGNLSGGQKNRLLLAKILADPKPLMILDEPTNDLDADTLELLEDMLAQYTGTLIVVSHDRDFLDQTVTKILAFEGDVQVEGYVGGYTDYLERRKAEAAPKVQKTETLAPVAALPVTVTEPKKPDRITFKQRHAYNTLPVTIAKLEEDIAGLRAQLNDPAFYQTDPAAFQKATLELANKLARLDKAEDEWLELSELMG